MEKKLQSSLKSSPESFISSATKLGLKPTTKPTFKTLIHSIDPSSNLSSSLPLALHTFISHSVASFQNLSEPSVRSPPSKRLRRSSRKSKTNAGSENENENESDGSRVNEKEQCVLRDLQVLSHITFLCVTNPKKAFVPESLLPGVSELHNNLVLFESDSALLSEIASLCEEWWKEELPGKETLISQSLPFLLSRSLTLKKKVDVHRVYVLREAFTMFDFEDESIEDLKQLLIRCLISPLYLKCDEGTRFISFILGLSVQLLNEALAMIRAQIPYGRKSMLEGYASIVFRAWKVAEGEIRDLIENKFLQGLVEGAIHASSASFAASVRRVLGGFINQRTTSGVEKLLYRLAEPVIFRSLQVANSNVRHNALHLLLDLFPLEDPDSTKEVKDTLLDKQFFLLERLLMDDCPDVRAVAVEGSCRILHLFWEIIPTSTITKITTKIFDDMSRDIHNMVRLSVVNGIIFLLGNPLSHELLKVLLPRLGHLMADSVLSVREAVGDLLLLLRDVRNFQFNKVVDLDVLLSALANDQPFVAQKITKLLQPSYFPSKLTFEEACCRCVTLMKRSPLAGARFCEFVVSDEITLNSLMKLVRVFIGLALSPETVNNELVEGLLGAAAHLCNHLASESSYKTTLKELFSGEKLKRLSAVATTGHAQSSLFNIVFTVSPDDVAGLVDECIHLVTNCSGIMENVEKQAEVRSAHKLIMFCDWFDDMVEAVAKLLEKAALTCHIKFGIEIVKQTGSAAKRKKSRSTVKISAKWKRSGRRKSSMIAGSMFEEEYLVTAGLAWQIKDLLVSEDNRKALLGSHALEMVFCALKAISEASLVHCIHCEYMDTSPVLAYTALALHMTINNDSVTCTNNQGTPTTNDFDSKRSFEGKLLDHTVDHLLNCSQKLLRAEESDLKARETSPDSPGPSNDGSSITREKMLANTVKMLTAVFKFFIDAFTMHLVSQYQEKLLNFASAYVNYLISNLKQHSLDQMNFKEGLKETFVYLKSSCTYATKLLNLALTNISEESETLIEATNLANNVLDLIIIVEIHLGSGYATRLVSSLRSWLPDMILALGSGFILKQNRGESTYINASDELKHFYPYWPSIIAKIEICEISETHRDDEEIDTVNEANKFSTFKKLTENIVLLLTANYDILDAFGVFLLTGVAAGLERKDFGLVLGLVHFICMKLIKQEHSILEQLPMMLACFNEIFPQIEGEIEELTDAVDEDVRHTLVAAKKLLESVMIYSTKESEGGSLMEE